MHVHICSFTIFGGNEKLHWIVFWKLKTELKLIVSFVFFQCFKHESLMLDANLNFSIFSIFPPLLASQLPTSPPRLRRNQERSVAENKTPRCCQYWLWGFSSTVWYTREKVPDSKKIGQNFHWRYFLHIGSTAESASHHFVLNHGDLIIITLYSCLRLTRAQMGGKHSPL